MIRTPMGAYCANKTASLEKKIIEYPAVAHPDDQLNGGHGSTVQKMVSVFLMHVMFYALNPTRQGSRCLPEILVM